MLISLAALAYVLTGVLPQPWATIVGTVLGMSGVSARDALKLAALPAREERKTVADQIEDEGKDNSAGE